MFPSERAEVPAGGPATRLPGEGLLAGVAAGLGRRLAIEPNLIRLAFALLAFLGGAGFLAYLGAWLLLPEPGRQSSAEGRSPWRLVAGGGLLAVAVVLAFSMISSPQPIGLLILAPIFVGITLLNLRPAQQGASAAPVTPAPAAAGPVPPPPTRVQPPPPSPPPPPAPRWHNVPPDPTTRIPDADPTTPLPLPDDPTTPLPLPLLPTDPTTVLDTTELSDPTGVLPDPDTGRAHWALPRTAAETAPGGRPGPTPTPTPPPPGTPTTVGRGGPPLASLSLAAISLLLGFSLVVANVAGADVSPVTVAGLATMIVGVSLTVAAYRGRALRLFPLVLLSGFALAMSPALAVGSAGGFGSSRSIPGSAADLDSSYRLGFGGLVLDLRSVRPDEDTTVVAEVGTGVLEILVADDVPVSAQATSTVGVVSIPGRSTGGLDRSLTFEGDGDGGGRLIIDARTSLGTVEVRRVGGRP